MPEEKLAPEFKLDGSQPARPALACYQIGGCDWVAATSEEEARRILAEMSGDDPAEYED